MKIKVLTITCILALIVGAISISNTRFWDSKRIQKSVAANVSKGDSEKFVVAWLTASNMAYTRAANNNGSFRKKQEVKDSGLNPNRISSVVATASK